MLRICGDCGAPYDAAKGVACLCGDELARRRAELERRIDQVQLWRPARSKPKDSE